MRALESLRRLLRLPADIAALTERVGRIEREREVEKGLRWPMPAVVPSVWTYPAPEPCPYGGEHDYPTGTYGSVVPPACRKCGKKSAGWFTLTATTNATATSPTTFVTTKGSGQ